MTTDDLRALADAIVYRDSLAIARAADYLRAQADAQPVAWVDVADSYGGPYVFRGKELLPAGRHDLYTHPAPAAPHYAMLDSHRRLVEQAIQNTEHPSGMSTHDGKARIDASILRRMLAIIDSLPAAPQAEPRSEPFMPHSRCGTPDKCRRDGVCFDAWACSSGPASQTEPKRPAFLDEIDRAKEHVASWPQWMKDATVSAAATLPVTEPKREPTGAVYGIIDPDYGRVYTIARKLAWEEGYAIGLHGSFTRDLDMIAVPWTDAACEPEHLIRRIVEATGLELRDGVGVKPHGRLAWTLLFPAFGDPRFVDLSVMPRIGGSDE